MLHKLLIAVGILAITTTANAENWQLLTDAENGTRLVVDTDSIMLTPYNDVKGEKSIAVSAKMAYIDSQESLQFISGIDGNECVYKGAGTIVNIFPDKTKNGYFWSLKGSKLFDAQGSWLCEYLVRYADQVDKQKNKQPATKQQQKPKIKV